MWSHEAVYPIRQPLVVLAAAASEGRDSLWGFHLPEQERKTSHSFFQPTPLFCFLYHHLGVEIAIAPHRLLVSLPATSYPQWAGTLPQTVAVRALSLSAENAEVVSDGTQRLALI